jgi:hypothetical protein
MFDKAIEPIDPRLLYGIPAIVLLTLTIAVLPRWGWLAVTAVLILAAAVTCAKIRRCGALDLPEVRPTALY